MAIYARGEAPHGALPDPEITLVRHTIQGQTVGIAGDIDLTGILVRVQAGPAPERGFHLVFQEADGAQVELEARTFADAVPDLKADRPVTLRLRMHDGLRITLSDGAGTAFLLFVGSVLPAETEDLPVRILSSQERAYSEVLATPDLCRWTWTHLMTEFAGDREHVVLAPGASRVLPSGSTSYRVTACDARSPEDTDCRTEGEPHWAFSWARLPPRPANTTLENERVAPR